MTRGDVVGAAMGVSGSLAGFTLVFLGIALTAFKGYSRDKATEVSGRFRLMIGSAGATFSLSLSCVVFGFLWLAHGQADWTYVVTMTLFYLQLALVLVLAVVTLRGVLEA